jgi:2-polyprenyl-3-methyl-5-hydroxy-6-metoxy-1,4-benzoquinol methylase
MNSIVARGLRKLERLALSLARSFRQTRDRNFIGFDKYQKSGAYHWGHLESNDDYIRRAEALRAFVAPGDCCLDLGCGDGALMYDLSGRCREVVGVDADFDAVRLAERKLAERGVTNCRVLQAPLSRVDLAFLGAAAPFDLMYSMDVIEHLPDPDELLQVAARSVKPRGSVVIGTPLFIRPDLVSSYHVREFTQAELRELLGRYLEIRQEIVLPLERQDGKRYEEGFCIMAGEMRCGS